MKQSSEFVKLKPFLKPYIGHMLLSLLFAAVSAVVQLLIPIFCGKAIDQMIDKGSVLFDGVLTYIFLIAVSALFSAIAQQLNAVLNNKITFGVSKDMRTALFAKLKKLPLS